MIRQFHENIANLFVGHHLSEKYSDIHFDFDKMNRLEVLGQHLLAAQEVEADPFNIEHAAQKTQITPLQQERERISFDIPELTNLWFGSSENTRLYVSKYSDRNIFCLKSVLIFQSKG